MKITIVHLFYDLMNLYGESGNVLAIQNCLLGQGLDVEIKNISLTDPLDLTDVDVIYMGSGTESNMMIALDYLRRHSDEINDAFSSKKFFLVTGNAIELFGKKIFINGQVIDGLNIFDYETTKSNSRNVSECIFNFDEIEEKILGFVNHSSEMSGISSPLFTVKKGIGSNKSSKIEGIHLNNFYGTYLIGPILARNPKFLEYFAKKIILNKYANFEFKDFDFEIEEKAYIKYLEKYN